MPLIVAHALAGATIFAAGVPNALEPSERRNLIVACALGVLPDIDLILPWVLGFGVRWHGGFTHSILFACASGILASRFLGRPTKRLTLLLIGAALSHGILDSVVKRTYSGAELLWPFSSKVFRLGIIDYFAFYPDSRLDPPGELAAQALQISFYELFIFGGLFVLVLLVRRWFVRFSSR